MRVHQRQPSDANWLKFSDQFIRSDGSFLKFVETRCSRGTTSGLVYFALSRRSLACVLNRGRLREPSRSRLFRSLDTQARLTVIESRHCVLISFASKVGQCLSSTILPTTAVVAGND